MISKFGIESRDGWAGQAVHLFAGYSESLRGLRMPSHPSIFYCHLLTKCHKSRCHEPLPIEKTRLSDKSYKGGI